MRSVLYGLGVAFMAIAVPMVAYLVFKLIISVAFGQSGDALDEASLFCTSMFVLITIIVAVVERSPEGTD